MTAWTLDRLRCPVCGRAGKISEDQKSFYCSGERRHSFDFARSGYLNLAVGAPSGGDSKEAIRARSAFLEAGYYQPLSDAVNELLLSCGAKSVLDAGCGEGYYTNRMPAECRKLGVDLSRFGVDHGAKVSRTNGTNADFCVASVFSIPVADLSFDAVTSLFAPCAEEELSRVLAPNGILILVGAGERHLMGLKELLYDHPYLNEGRRDLPKNMKLLEKKRLFGEIEVKGRQMLDALFSMTPYYWRTSERDREKLLAVDSLRTEYDFDIFVFRKESENA